MTSIWGDPFGPPESVEVVVCSLSGECTAAGCLPLRPLGPMGTNTAVVHLLLVGPDSPNHVLPWVVIHVDTILDVMDLMTGSWIWWCPLTPGSL